jgi:hypothetical protein
MHTGLRAKAMDNARMETPTTPTLVDAQRLTDSILSDAQRLALLMEEKDAYACAVHIAAARRELSQDVLPYIPKAEASAIMQQLRHISELIVAPAGCSEAIQDRIDMVRQIFIDSIEPMEKIGGILVFENGDSGINLGAPSDAGVAFDGISTLETPGTLIGTENPSSLWADMQGESYGPIDNKNAHHLKIHDQNAKQ